MFDHHDSKNFKLKFLISLKNQNASQDRIWLSWIAFVVYSRIRTASGVQNLDTLVRNFRDLSILTMKSCWFVSHSFHVHYAALFIDNNIFNNTTIRGNIIIDSFLYWKHHSNPICNWIYSSSFFVWMQSEIPWFQGTIPIHSAVFPTFRHVKVLHSRKR